jgi:hypothetical protein
MKKHTSLGICVALSSLALSSPAWAVIEWDLGTNVGGNFDWTYQSSPLHLNQDTNATNSLGGNMFQLQGIMSTPNPHCIELETTGASDTRIFVNDHSVQRSVNDDFGGTLNSKARIWLSDTAGATLDWVSYVGAFSSAHNNEIFQLRFTRRDISMAACTTGQTTIPWAKIIGNTISYTVTLSPNAT